MEYSSDIPQSKPWEGLAKHWSLLGSPLRPAEEDLQRLRTAWLDSLPQGVPHRRIDVLLLGVTPEIAGFRWAPDSSLTAIDSSDRMISAVWPGDGPTRRAILGDWLRTPFPDASFDLILCDGGLAVLDGLNRIAILSREMRRVVRPDGRMVIRHYSRPAQPESPADLVKAVAAREIHNFNVLKLRLLLALPCDGAGAAVHLPTALEWFNRLFPDRARLADQLGCTLEIISAIDAYRVRDASYGFASPAEIARCCADFSMAPGPDGTYPLAECCPVYSFSPA